MDNKKQHWIPKSYLDAWVDPFTPAEQDGYIWHFDKDGSQPKKKSPKKSFRQSEFYTNFSQVGERDLSLEKKLSIIEGDFIDVRREKLISNEHLSQDDIIKIIIYASVMMHRTKISKDKDAALWNYICEVGEDLQQKIKISPDPIKIYSLEKINPENSMSLEEVKEIANQTMFNLLRTKAYITAKALLRMRMHFLHTSNDIGFITSDYPCIAFDPVTAGLNALGSPTIEITMPISPQLLVIFFWGTGPNLYEYRAATELMVNEFNRRTRFFCREHFIVNQNFTKPFWFE